MPPSNSRAGNRKPAGVLLLSAEDDAARVIRPRLEAAGADLARVTIFDRVDFGDYSRPPTLPEDLDDLKRLAEEQNAELVVVDPLMAFLSTQFDAHKDQHVRRVLHGLKTIAESTGAAVVVVRHLNKQTGGPAIYRGGGSIGIIGAARSGLLVGKHPRQVQTSVLAMTKSNLAPLAPSLAYSMERHGNGSRIRWGGEVDVTADDLTAPSRGKPRRESAAQWLREALAGGPVAQADVEKRAVGAGISLGTLKRAKKELGVVSRKEKSFGDGGKWLWSLPESQGEAPGKTEEAPEAAQDSEEAQLRRFDDLRSLGETDDAERLALLDSAEAAFGDAELGDLDLPDADDGDWPADQVDWANDALAEAAADDWLDDEPPE